MIGGIRQFLHVFSSRSLILYEWECTPERVWWRSESTHHKLATGSDRLRLLYLVVSHVRTFFSLFMTKRIWRLVHGEPGDECSIRATS